LGRTAGERDVPVVLLRAPALAGHDPDQPPARVPGRQDLAVALPGQREAGGAATPVLAALAWSMWISMRSTWRRCSKVAAVTARVAAGGCPRGGRSVRPQ